MGVLFPGPVTVYRGTGGEYVKGKWTAGTREEITITGRVRHFIAYELETLPDGKSDIGHVKIFSNDPLVISEDEGDTNGDYIYWQGSFWEVVKLTHVPMGVINHYRYEAEFRTAKDAENEGITPP
jgi:hypothetical protein